MRNGLSRINEKDDYLLENSMLHGYRLLLLDNVGQHLILKYNMKYKNDQNNAESIRQLRLKLRFILKSASEN